MPSAHISNAFDPRDVRRAEDLLPKSGCALDEHILVITPRLIRWKTGHDTICTSLTA